MIIHLLRREIESVCEREREEREKERKREREMYDIVKAKYIC